MRQAWLRKQFIDMVIDDVASGTITIADATDTLQAFILGISLKPRSIHEEALAKAIVHGILELVGAGSMDKAAGSNYILRLADLSKTGERLNF